MKEQAAGISFRRVLPIIQLLICIIALWPSRYFVLFELSQSLEAYALVKPQRPLPPINVDIPTLTPQQQKEADRAATVEELRMKSSSDAQLPCAHRAAPVYACAARLKRMGASRYVGSGMAGGGLAVSRSVLLVAGG